MAMTACHTLGRLIRTTLPRTSSALASGMSSSKNSSAVISREGTLCRVAGLAMRYASSGLQFIAAACHRVEPPGAAPAASTQDAAVEGAGGEAELLEGVVEQALPGVVETAVAAEVLVRHRRVDRGRAGRAEAGELHRPRGRDARADDGGGLARGGAQLAQREGRHLDVQVDAVEQRAGDAAAVALDQRRQAGAGVAGVAEMAAGAGV